jgi:hypothetical protein
MYRLQLLLFTLFGVSACANHHGNGPPNACHQYYPNIAGELLLEKTVKYGDEAKTSLSPDAEIGWSETGTPASAMHESGNTGDEPIDLIWVTLKPGCMATPE